VVEADWAAAREDLTGANPCWLRAEPLDGAFWPKSGEAGTPEQPVVLLEVQMHSKPGFKHRLFAQTARFLHLTPGSLPPPLCSATTACQLPLSKASQVIASFR
jgi:hypothetical protein